MRRRAQRGFTLVELLVALTLLSLVAAMLFGALRFGARSWEAVSERTADRDAVAAAQGFLRARLGEASRPGGAGEPLSLAGDSSRLVFVAPWETGPAPGGLYRFAIFREGDVLMLAWSPEAGAGPNGRRGLIDGASELRVAYFGTTDPAAAPVWRDAWQDADGAPALVRIELAFADPTRLWPPLIIRRGP